MKRKKAEKTIAATLALAIVTMPALSWSGWVDDWMTQKTATSPSYYEGAKRGYYTGGTFSARPKCRTPSNPSRQSRTV